MNRQTNDPSQQLRIKWDQRYADEEKIARPAEVLLNNAHLLPKQGSTLDLACGLGGNALFLASRGFVVEAWDLSAVAIQRLEQSARQQNLNNLHARVRDVENHPPSTEQFDVIVVSYFLERALIPALIQALKPDGLLFYQTFTQLAVSSEGPQNPAFRLADQELLQLFRDLKVRLYREEGRLGDLSLGSRDVAMLVAQK
ncbi:MAG: methyltransferase domain-containing protein [Candidatus Thiodiazotropha lotti]|uniref:Methyltransferase type 12 n=1 Tax=Candidatus Thiodiazotropha endoloripes TaxID=1818881 RepID=A0A1E2UTZ2_9GAMM|nr:methyltransferase domain-containing protein [Candidatus Thiodiazotropha endoloripes]MCG7900316.1 methyltransferase domain-containing protein [Candidatus Thiodiazotropha weberae]MCG7991112.1 methyltransferase domain-containing protein [Candidatus Thiodiazotropha lotti]MCG7902925.1 methyltransferase domain-containing protein [Candidatus Thiodiazotropha weberae]MCG7914983.1 methyltransferase domain-containing protein [Candidatus Thiodiazotropha weberae]MCG8001322.1 methyltransferase domain-con